MNYTGELFALSAAFLWSATAIIFTAASKKIRIIQLNIDRMIVASILLTATILLFNIDYEINSKQLLFLTLSGIAGLVIGDTFLFKALKEIGPRVTLLLMSSNPAIATVLAYFWLGEVLNIWGIIGITVTLSGISLVILQKESAKKAVFKKSNIGILYGFLAAAGQGTGLILAKLAYVEAPVHGLTATFFRILASIVIMIPVAYIFKRWENPVKIYMKEPKTLGILSMGAVTGPYLGITASFVAIIYAKVGIASTLMSTMPIIMLPLSHFVYKEHLSWKSIVGAVIAVTGVSILFLK